MLLTLIHVLLRKTLQLSAPESTQLENGEMDEDQGI